jgi:hypothetical protein
MSQRCISWRPARLYPADEHHRIGTRPWWRPCRRVLRPGEWLRCRECSLALADHPDAFIRLALAEEEAGAVSRDAVLALTTDSDAIVALSAEEHLARLNRMSRRRTRTGQAALTGTSMVAYVALRALGIGQATSSAASEKPHDPDDE